MATKPEMLESFNEKGLKPDVAEEFSKLSAQLGEQYGKAARVTPAQYPADPNAKTGSGQELRTNYKGYIVAVSPNFVAQRVDTGQSRTSIVVHPRDALDVPANTRSGEFPPLKEKLASGRVERFDLSIGYGADGKAKVYDRDRKMEDVQLAAKTLARHSGLDGAKKAAFEKGLEGAVANFREDHYNVQKERANAYMAREAQRSQAHNLVQGREAAS